MMLRQLYLRGPTYLGFWGGADAEDICADLTGTPSRTWRVDIASCADIIERRYQSFRVLVSFAFLCVVLWQVLVTALVCFQFLLIHLAATSRTKQHSHLIAPKHPE